MAKEKPELAEFVISKVLEPVMRAKADGKSEGERRALEHVQRATQSEIERYRGYASAQEVCTNDRRDLTSSAAKSVQNDLKRLKLPTLADIKDKIEKAKELGVKSS